MATRSASFWPFLSTSIWNQPIGTGAVYVNASLPPRTTATVGQELIVLNMDFTQPDAPVYKNTGQHDPNRCLGSSGLFSPAINIPYNQNLLIPSSNLNYPGAFIGDPTANPNVRWEAGNFAHCTNGGKVTAGHMNNSGTIVDNGLGGASGGSGLSTLGGTIRYGEFTNGTAGDTVTVGGFTFHPIRHALRFNLNGHTDLSSAGSGWRWPATHADGGYNDPSSNNYYGGSVPASVEGSLYAIRQSVPLTSLGIQTTAGMQMAWTMQNYGGYVCNDSVGSEWPICIELSAVGSVLTEFQALYGFNFRATAGETGAGAKWSTDMAVILGDLYVVDNNTSSNIGGGGTPLQPLAPSFGASLNAPFLQQVNNNTTAASSTLTVQNAATTLGSALSLLVGARAPAAGVTPSQATPSWEESAESGTGNTTVVLVSRTVTATHFVTVTALNRVASVGPIASVVGTLGNTYTKLTGASVQSTTNLRLEVWGGHITTGGTETITVTFAGTGAGAAIASEWVGLSEALDVAVVTNSGTGTPVTTGASAQTVSANDVCIAAYGVVGSNTFSGEAFSPVGTTLNVPDLNVQVTGADNCTLEVSEILSGAAGVAQSFSSAVTGSTGWCSLLVILSPAASGGSAPTVSIAGGGTWTQRFSVNSPSGLGNSSGWDLNPTGSVGANGITVTSSSSVGSIESEFYEIANATYNTSVTATGTSTSPTVTVTPANANDVQVGSIFVPNSSSTISSTTPSSWENDDLTVGLASNANSSILSGGNVSGSASAQTYSGTNAPSAPWVAAIMDYEQISVPAQVAQPTIAPGQGQVSVNWNTPATNGSPLVSYTAKVWSGVTSGGTGGTLASTITGIAVSNYAITPYVITGLTNGVMYSVSIIAINGVGASTESQRSLGASPFLPSGVPGTPVAPSVLIGDTTVQVTITPPATGGVPITGYTFNCYDPYPTLFATQTQLSNVFTFSGLTDGLPYGFTGIAINGNGPSLESPVTIAIPEGVPGTPNAPAVVAGNAQVTSTITPPAANGSPITQYIHNCYKNPAQAPVLTQTLNVPVATFASLSNGTTYYLTGIAVNGIGESSESSATPGTPEGSGPTPPISGGTPPQNASIYQYVYKGKTTNMLYKFAPSQVPSAVLDQYGNLLEYGTYNGETIVWASQTGEVRRSTKGDNPTDPYSPGIAVSPWESNV
jgi:hypothetical protein